MENGKWKMENGKKGKKRKKEKKERPAAPTEVATDSVTHCDRDSFVVPQSLSRSLTHSFSYSNLRIPHIERKFYQLDWMDIIVTMDGPCRPPFVSLLPRVLEYSLLID